MKKHQKFSLLAVAVALAFVGLMTTCDNFNRLVEEQRKEQMLEQRRNKIDSLSLEKIIMLEIGNEDGTTR